MRACVCINSMCAERYLLGDAGSKVGENARVAGGG